MKKFIAIGLVLVILLAFVGCGDEPVQDSGSTTESTTSTTGDPAPTESTVLTNGTSSATSGKTTVTTKTTTKPSGVISSTTKTTATTKPSGTTKPSTQGTQAPTQSTAQTTTQSTAASTTKSTTTTKTTTTTRAALPCDQKIRDFEVGFGYYCVNFDKYGFNTEWKELTQSNYVNTVFCNQLKFLSELKDNRCKTWVSVTDIYNMVRQNAAGWQDEFDELNQQIVDSGYEDVVLGWYLDEPSHMDAIKAITKYAKEKYGRRFFICFMVQTTDPTVDNNYIDANRHITKDSMQYLTDIAMDYYGDPRDSVILARFNKLFNKLKEVKAPGTKMWYVPCTFGSKEAQTNMSEANRQIEYRANHIQYMYNELMKLPKAERGGIVCFAWDYDSNEEKIMGVGNLVKTNSNWNTVINKAKEIGKKICCG